MGRKKGQKNKPKDEVKQVEYGAGIEEAATTQDEPVATETKAVINPETPVVTPVASGEAVAVPAQVESVKVAPKQPEITAQKEPETLFCDTWLYHEENEPKIFKQGSQVLEGWQRNQKNLSGLWTVDGSGKWSRSVK